MNLCLFGSLFIYMFCMYFYYPSDCHETLVRHCVQDNELIIQDVNFVRF